jgi:hypothetical protein
MSLGQAQVRARTRFSMQCILLASQITNLSGVVSTLGGRLSAIESGLDAAAPASAPAVVAPPPVGPQPPSLSPSPSLLNLAAAPFQPPPQAGTNVYAPESKHLQNSSIPAPSPSPALPTSPLQLKLKAQASYPLRGPGLEFITSELIRRDIPLLKDTSLNWASKGAPWRTLIIGFPGTEAAQAYQQRANSVLQRMGPSAGFTISEWQPVLQRQAQ